MHRDEELAAGAVGNVGPRLQVVEQRSAQLLVRLARIDHLHPGHPLLDEPPQTEHHRQREVLLVDLAVVRPGELAAMARIEHDDLEPRRNIFRLRTVHKNGAQRKGHCCKKSSPHIVR